MGPQGRQGTFQVPIANGGEDGLVFSLACGKPAGLHQCPFAHILQQFVYVTGQVE
jgi:hypothetical protein